MQPMPDFPDERSPDAIEVFRLSPDDGLRWSHVYMEAQIFTPDSKRLILHRSADAHLCDRKDPDRAYVLCDLENGGELIPLTGELGACAPSVTPDGAHVYYFDDETVPGGGRLTLKRVGIDGNGRETIAILDGALPATPFRLSRPYPLSTISSDGKRLAISGFLGDGHTENAEWGLVVFDLDTAEVNLILHGPTWCNIHPQYSRSLDAEHSHDILIQENHDNGTAADGSNFRLTGGLGADVHVIRDDGAAFRNMPWGRDVNEHCQGHQCWRGRSTRAITSSVEKETGLARLIEGVEAPFSDHLGMHTPGAQRNDLTAEFARPRFYHFGTDIAGSRLISDAFTAENCTEIYLLDLPEADDLPAPQVRYLVNARVALTKDSHPHPFLSPDGQLGFFNSNESGGNQTYMIAGLENV